jgi:hypothetical protein
MPSAVLVACLASFRALFVQKNRASEAEEARKRELLQREGSHSKTKAIWARAKYFQQSLFESIKSEAAVTKADTADDAILPLSNLSFTDHGLLMDNLSQVETPEVCHVSPKPQM